MRTAAAPAAKPTARDDTGQSRRHHGLGVALRRAISASNRWRTRPTVSASRESTHAVCSRASSSRSLGSSLSTRSLLALAELRTQALRGSEPGHLDGLLTSPLHPPDLAVSQSRRPHREELAVGTSHSLESPGEDDPVGSNGGGRGGTLVGYGIRQGHDRAPLAGVVDGQVAGDAKQPAARGDPPMLEPGPGLPGTQERFRHQLFRRPVIADRGVQVAQNGHRLLVVEFEERLLEISNSIISRGNTHHHGGTTNQLAKGNKGPNPSPNRSAARSVRLASHLVGRSDTHGGPGAVDRHQGHTHHPLLLHRLPEHIPVQVGGRLRARLRVADPEHPIRLDPLKDRRIQLAQVYGIPHEHLENVDGGARGLHHAGTVWQWLEALEITDGCVDHTYSMAGLDQQLSGNVTHGWG